MIARFVRIHELTRRTLADGTEACSALVSFDEAALTTLRLSRVEHDGLAALMRSDVRFVVELRPIDPHTITATNEGESK